MENQQNTSGIDAATAMITIKCCHNSDDLTQQIVGTTNTTRMSILDRAKRDLTQQITTLKCYPHINKYAKQQQRFRSTMIPQRSQTHLTAHRQSR
jgi:hypothetical protein